MILRHSAQGAILRAMGSSRLFLLCVMAVSVLTRGARAQSPEPGPTDDAIRAAL